MLQPNKLGGWGASFHHIVCAGRQGLRDVNARVLVGEGRVLPFETSTITPTFLSPAEASLAMSRRPTIAAGNSTKKESLGTYYCSKNQ